MREPSTRSRRVADLLHRELAQAMRANVHDPRLATLTITHVKMSSDLKSAKVYFTMHNREQPGQAMTALSKATPYLRRLLANATDLRYTPKLYFAYDDVVVQAERVQQLIDRVDASAG